MAVARNKVLPAGCYKTLPMCCFHSFIGAASLNMAPEGKQYNTTTIIHASDNCKVLFAEGCRLLQERLCRSRPQRPFTLLATVCCTSYASLSGLLYRTSYPKAYIRDRGLPILVLVRTSDTFRAPPTLKNPNFPSDELICR